MPSFRSLSRAIKPQMKVDGAFAQIAIIVTQARNWKGTRKDIFAWY